MATFTAGTSFTDGVTGDVTAAKLNALVANATPLSNLITDRTAETSIATDDLVLISDTSDSGALNKMTVANFTNIVSTGTGTAADPAIRPTGDTNTGIFFPAADTIAFSEGGTESMRIDSNGRVGIGTTSPSYRLHNYQNGNSANLTVTENASSAAGAYSGLGASSNTIDFALRAYSSSFNTFAHAGINLAGWAEAWLGTLSGAGPQGFLIGTDSASPIVLATNNAERLRIDSSGNVGVGTPSPTYRMSVDTSAQTILSCNSTDANGGYAAFLRSGTVRGFIGSANPLVSGGSNNDFAIRAESNLVFATNTNTERLRITSGGNVQIGLTDTNLGRVNIGGFTNGDRYGIAFKPSANNSAPALFVNASGTEIGSISCTASATSYTTTSDYRLKSNLEPISNGIDRIKQLPVYRFNWIVDENGNKVDGFVAHEAQAIVPECVTGEKDAVDEDGKPIYQGIDQSKIVPLLTAALKEAIAKIETLEAKVAALEAA